MLKKRMKDFIQKNILGNHIEEAIDVRWLMGHRYTLWKKLTLGDKVAYQWYSDDGECQSCHWSHDMADVHFGSWLNQTGGALGGLLGGSVGQVSNRGQIGSMDGIPIVNKAQ